MSGALDTLISSAITDILIPEIAIVFRTHANAGLPPPTSDQVIAALVSTTQAGITVGEAWLAAHPAVGKPAAAPSSPATTTTSSPSGATSAAPTPGTP